LPDKHVVGPNLTLCAPRSIGREDYDGQLVVGYAKRRLRNDEGAGALSSCFRILVRVSRFGEMSCGFANAADGDLHVCRRSRERAQQLGGWRGIRLRISAIRLSSGRE
jgi:hypothetical protein